MRAEQREGEARGRQQMVGGSGGARGLRTGDRQGRGSSEDLGEGEGRERGRGERVGGPSEDGAGVIVWQLGEGGRGRLTGSWGT